MELKPVESTATLLASNSQLSIPTPTTQPESAEKIEAATNEADLQLKVSVDKVKADNLDELVQSLSEEGKQVGAIVPFRKMVNPYDDPHLYFLVVSSPKFANFRYLHFKTFKELEKQNEKNENEEYYIKSANLIPQVP